MMTLQSVSFMACLLRSMRGCAFRRSGRRITPHYHPIQTTVVHINREDDNVHRSTPPHQLPPYCCKPDWHQSRARFNGSEEFGVAALLTSWYWLDNHHQNSATMTKHTGRHKIGHGSSKGEIRTTKQSHRAFSITGESAHVTERSGQVGGTHNMALLLLLS